MKILVLGSSGFIGTNMVEYFADHGHDVIAAYHTQIPTLGKATRYVKANLLNEYDVARAMESVDVVIQAAATTSGSKDIVHTPAIHVTDNAVMNSYIFPAAVKAGVKHVIFFSCTVMYPDGVCTEETLPAPHDKYFGAAHTKMYCEKLCEFYSRLGDTRFTAIRHSNIYGPFDKYDLERSHVFGATVTKVMQAADKVTVWGTGEESRDFLHADDLCRFVELALEKQTGKFGLYNCGSGVAVPVKELVQKVIEASGKKLEIEYDLTAPTIPTSLSLDCAKAQRELGWKSEVSLSYGINKTVKWWKENYS